MTDYVNRQRQGYDAEAVSLASATITANGNGSAIHVGENVEIDVVSAVRGTVSGTSPTLDVTVECSEDAAFTTPIPLGALPQQTAAGEVRGLFRTTAPYVRAVATVGGTTPSFGATEVFIVS